MPTPIVASVRLGKDSTEDSKRLNQSSGGMLASPILLDVVCKQVPTDLAKGSFVIIWLGSDNDKGKQTEWKQGFRAIGKVRSVEPEQRSKDDDTTIAISVGYVFKSSINRLDILRDAPQSYYWCSSLPIIGLDDRANQTARVFDETKERSSIGAFFYSLSQVNSNIKESIPKLYPELSKFFEYTPSDPSGDNVSLFEERDTTPPTPAQKGENVILYGVPGAGKSFTIKRDYCDNDESMEKAVFHPDYTYGDFIGQILPVVSKNNILTYSFVPGPFSRILRKAFWNPGQQFYLVIDEINRGNAPSIFGDIFQLLDRDEETGRSEYMISNPSVAQYVYSDDEGKSTDLSTLSNLRNNSLVFMPSNLSIIATMNTSDQNVFTLDTAFQRRWHMRHIDNDFKNCTFADERLLDTNITWEQFASIVNQRVTDANSGMMSAEDKRLGIYFVKRSDIEGNNERTIESFADKVIKYLWDDAFHFARSSMFNSRLRTLDEIFDEFEKHKGDNRFTIFEQSVVDNLKRLSQENDIQDVSSTNED